MSIKPEQVDFLFRYLMTLNYQGSFSTSQMKNVVILWTAEFNEVGISPQELERGFKRYAREGFGLWPTFSTIIRLGLDLPDLEIEFERVRKIVRALPSYTGSEYSARQIETEWRRRVALEYPEGLPPIVAEGLEAIGGYHGLKRKMGQERPDSMLSASRVFKRAATSAASSGRLLEANSSAQIEVKQ
jgi:hypothetical protein